MSLIHAVTTTNFRSRAASAAVLAALALMIPACGGSNSDQREQGPALTETAAPGPALSVEWTNADMEQATERIGYGSAPKGILARNAEGVLVFTPQTERDHIATRFTALPDHGGERTLELVLDMKSPGGEACTANLQDQAFNVLTTVPCKDAGEQRATAKVPAGVTRIRVYFQSPKRQPLHLPAGMRILEHRSS